MSKNKGVLVVSFMLAAAAIAFVFFMVGTENILNIAAAGTGENQEKIRSFYTAEKMRILFGFFAFVFSGAAVWSVFRGDELITVVVNAYQSFKSRLSRTLQNVSTFRLVFAAIVILIQSLFAIGCAWSFPMTNDETFTFINYINRGFAAAFTLYNEPNNHVLYSLSANVFNLLPIGNEAFRIRIPSITIGVLTSLSFYLLALKTNRKYSAEFALVLFTSGYIVLKYQFLARGYGMMMFCAAGQIYAVLSALSRGKAGALEKVLFVLCTVAGIYAHPTYIIPVAALLIFAVLMNKNNIRQFFYPVLISAVAVIVVYMPLLILNGITAFVSNSGVEAAESGSLTANIGKTVIGLFLQNSYDSVAGVVLLFVAFAAGAVKGKKKLPLLFGISVLVAFMILLAAGSPLFIRNLLWMLIPAVLVAARITCFTSAFNRRLNGILMSILIAALVASTALKVFVFEDVLKNYYHRLFKAYDFKNELPQDFGSLYSEHKADYYTVLLRSIRSESGHNGQLFRTDFNPEQPYRFILNTKKEKTRLHKSSRYNYELYYEDEYVSVYQIKDR